MAISDGFIIKQNFKLISVAGISGGGGLVTSPLFDEPFDECCGDNELLVFTDQNNLTNKYKNDRTGHIFNLPALTNSADLFLDFQDPFTEAWSVAGQLNGNNVGTFYALNFYVNVYSEKYIGYQLDWSQVNNTFGKGYGKYRIRCVYTDLLTGVNTLTTYTYKQMPYSSQAAQGTVRFEYYMNRLSIDDANDKHFFDYSTLNWYNSVRVRGNFGYPKPQLNATYITYTNERKQLPDEIQLTDEFELNTKLVKSFVHNIFREMVFADDIIVNNYDKYNPHEFVNKSVTVTGYDNEWFKGTSRKGAINMKFGKRYKNDVKRW